MYRNQTNNNDNQLFEIDTDQTMTVQLETGYNTIEGKKCLWIMFLMITSILALIIPIIIIKSENTSVKETLTTKSIQTTTTTTTIQKQMTWKRKGMTIAGGVVCGNKSNQFHSLAGMCIDDENKNMYIVDAMNNRLVQWKIGSDSGEIILGENGRGNRSDQLYSPRDVIIDKYNNNSLIICDRLNYRILRWFPEKKINPQIMITDIACCGLALDKNGSLYIVDADRNSVRRWKQGEKDGTIVAGGHGVGNKLNQLDSPAFILVDDNYTIYVSDTTNDRVMKWPKDATEGIIINKERNEKLLNYPQGIAMDKMGQLYIVDSKNHRILRWREGDIQGEVIINENGYGRWSEYLHDPWYIVFDSQENLIVTDRGNCRIQKFEVDSD